MLTSNRLDFRPYTRSASATISNRRVRTRTHGGVAGVGGQPPPLCRSNALTEHVKSGRNHMDGNATYQVCGIGLVNTSSFLGANPADEPITSGLPSSGKNTSIPPYRL
jgi:hypothetical protein